MEGNTLLQLQKRITKLRVVVAQHPSKYKARSKLSHLLMEYSKCSSTSSIQGENNNGINQAEKLRMEAYEHAQKCIELAPNDSIGHGALYNSSSNYQERMDALRKAIDLESKNLLLHEDEEVEEETKNNVSSSFSSLNSNTSKLVGMSFALCRLLMDPREEEKIQLKLQQQQHSNEEKKHGGRCILKKDHHPSKRDLNSEEALIYTQIKNMLHKAESAIKNNNNNNPAEEDHNDIEDNHDHHHNGKIQQLHVSNNLAISHYKLGIFFRKLQPESKHRLTSSYHFRQCLQFLSSSHSLVSKCQFWIATFGDNGDENYSNVVGGNSNEAMSSSSSLSFRIDRCPEEYVISLYSTFAAKFDDLLVNKLKYQTPTKLRKVVDNVQKDLLPPETGSTTTTTTIGLDLGCGTGLSGIAFQECVTDLYGIDISPEMIEKAKLRQCYTKLYVGELERIFHEQEFQKDKNGVVLNCYDLIIACDVFVYIGELKAIFHSVYEKLQPRTGMFAFSTEFLEESSNGNGDDDPQFVLQKCARFAHKRSYIERIANEVGFHVKYLEKSVIRRNQGKDVTGLLAVLIR